MAKKTAYLIAFLLVAALVVSPLVSQTAGQAEKQLRAAMDKETVDGDLKAAIEQYKKLIAASNTPRAIKARALLQLGGCYEKQGNAEARKTFEQLLNEYSDQPEVVAQARTRLTALSALPGPASGTGPSLRQVRMNPPMRIRNISPNGRYVSAYDREAIYVQDLASGTKRQLTINAKDFVMDEAWSRDGKSLAYLMETGKGGYFIGIWNPEEDKSRTLFSLTSPWSDAWDIALAPDDSFIVTNVTGDDAKNCCGLLKIDVATGLVRTFASSEFSCSNPAVAPSGRYAACMQLGSEQFIFIQNLENGNVTKLEESKGTGTLIGWAPDGNTVLFTKKQSASDGIYLLRLSGEKTQGPAELIRPNPGAPIGLTRQGSLLYSASYSLPVLDLVTMDTAGSKPASPPVRIETPNIRAGSSFAWSPDGKTLAFSCSDSAGDRSIQTPYSLLCLWPAAGGPIRQVKLDATIRDWQLRWHAGGEYLLAQTEGPERGFCRIDPRSGHVEKTGVSSLLLEWSSDGKRVYVLLPTREEKCFVIREINLETGEKRDLYRADPKITFYSAKMSPDEQWLAIDERIFEEGELKWSALTLIGIKDGRRKELVSPSVVATWCSDSKHILYTSRPSNGQDPIKMLMPIEGGAPRQIDFGLPIKNIGGYVPHPDGKRFVIKSVQSTPTEYWLLENFIPPAKPAGELKK
jgi:Tol biopolymer transport system component